MPIYVGYQPAVKCSGGPTPGARALMAWYLGMYGARGGVNTGIYNCRPVRGGGSYSLHAEGRAADLGVRPYRATWGTELAELLRQHSGELGIQLIIWNRRVWSGSYPNSGWRPYTGLADHFDHLHVELSRPAAATLTSAKCAAVLGASAGAVIGKPVPIPRPVPAPPKPLSLTEDEEMDVRFEYDGDGKFRAAVKVENDSPVAARSWFTLGAAFGPVRWIVTVHGADGVPYRASSDWDAFDMPEAGHYAYEIPKGARTLVLEGTLLDPAAMPIAAVWHQR